MCCPSPAPFGLPNRPQHTGGKQQGRVGTPLQHARRGAPAEEYRVFTPSAVSTAHGSSRATDSVGKPAGGWRLCRPPRPTPAASAAEAEGGASWRQLSYRSYTELKK